MNRTNKWLPYLLPPPDQEAFVLQESGMTSSDSPSSPTTATSIRRLIDETSDLIDSPSFTHVLTLLLDAAFSHLIDVKISALAYKIPPISESSARVQEIVGSGEVKAKVASSLAVFCREASKIGAGSNNEYAEKVESVRGLEAFAAVVYSSHFEFESPEAVAVSAALVPLESAVEEQKEGVSTTLGVEQILGPGVDKGEAEAGETGLESAWSKALKKEDGIA
jgi:peroxin-3